MVNTDRNLFTAWLTENWNNTVGFGGMQMPVYGVLPMWFASQGEYTVLCLRGEILIKGTNGLFEVLPDIPAWMITWIVFEDVYLFEKVKISGQDALDVLDKII